MNSAKRFRLVFAGLIILLPVFFLIDLMLGSVRMTVGESVDALFGNGSVTNIEIMQSIRLPKAFTAIFAGMALSVCGVLMQTLFRNPLAGPYVLGVNAGASLGVATMMIGGGLLGIRGLSVVFQSGVVLASVVGAVVVLLIIMAVSGRIRSNMGLLLAGIMLGQIVSAIQSLMEYFADANSLRNFVLWNMASIGNVTSGDLVWLTPLVLFFVLITFLLTKDLDVLLLGDEYAQSMGINIKQRRMLIIIITGILTGIITAFCGPVAFIGIAVPHISRMLLRSSLHRYLIPVSILSGPSILLFCDILCQLPGKGVVLPLNVVTAMVGAPVVLYLLFKNFRFIN